MIYSDLNLSLARHPVTDDIVRLTDMDAVRRAVKTLLLTALYERPFEPGIGSRLSMLLFEPMDTVTERLIVEEIRRVLTLYEPRANLLSITATPFEDQNALEVVITFSVLQFTQPTSVQLTLARIR